MRRIVLFFIVLGILSVAVHAQAATTIGTLRDEHAYDSEDLNFRYFQVNTTKADSYFAEFWISPAKYSNGLYTTFFVFVNNEYVGTIQPTYGNCQAARMYDCETIKLNDGNNIIAVATKAPEIPDVEKVCVSINDSEAEISSDNYDEYLNSAKIGTIYEVPFENAIPIMSASNSTDVRMVEFRDVPLNYTFYKVFSFTEDQEIFITSTSRIEHNIDVIFYGTRKTTQGGLNPFNPPTIGATIIKNDSTSITIPETPSIKLDNYYQLASSEEMQGLNWKGPSQMALNASTYVATIRMTIPKSGIYLVRVHTKDSGATGVADVNVDGKYFYENAPMSFTHLDCVIPADGNKYATMTYCHDVAKDDPILFIHGAGDDRIVGFNDDATPSIKYLNDLAKNDSYICQKYFMPTTGISVNNFSSSSPISKCSVLSLVKKNGPSNSKMLAKRTSNETTDLASISRTEIIVDIPSSVNIGSDFSIRASEDIESISVYSISGECLSNRELNGDFISMPVSSLGISQPGIYVVCVNTLSSTRTSKLTVK